MSCRVFYLPHSPGGNAACFDCLGGAVATFTLPVLARVKRREHLLHLGCLAGQLFSCCGAFFGAGGVLLGDLVDQSQTVGDFTDALRLIARCSSDFLEQIGDLGRAAHDFIQSLGRLFGHLDSLVGQFDRAFNQGRGFFSGLGAAGCQVADLFGDNGETFTVLTGAGGFDRGVEGQQVGLEGDFIDNLDDLADVLAGVA